MAITINGADGINFMKVKRSDLPEYAAQFNGVADLEERAKKIDGDIAAAKEKYGENLPSGNYGSFIVPEKGETKVSISLVSHEGNTYDYRVDRRNVNYDTAEFSEASKAASAAKAEDNDGSKNAKGLTDRDIFIIFTGREPKKSSPSSLGGIDMSGTEDMFDENGNFIYKDNEDFVKSMKSFYELTIFSGIPFDEHCPKNVADFFGNVGKRIDEAYAAGKCTDEQKEMLDKMLNENAEYYSNRVQRQQALLKICREEFNMPIAERNALYESRKEKTPEENMADRKKQIDEYVEKYFKVEKKTLFEMINAVRYGVLNILPKSQKQ